MILSRPQEIESYLPTSKWKDAQSLLAYTEEEEANILLPVLGQELLDHLTEEYDRLVAERQGITPQEFPVDEVDDTVRLIRMCQKAVLYMALANNSGLLSVSFNPGGGMNVVSAEYYEKADKETLARFERDAYKKAHRNVDAMLTLLERDAQKAEPRFAEMWKKSRYFYLQSHLLITTATQMQDYLDIKGSRERYIELVPDLKYCQSTYLAPRLGDALTKAFVQSATDADVIPTIKDETKTEAELLAMNAEVKADWNEALDRLRAALANYAEYRNPKLRREAALSEADMSMARALEYITAHQSSFLPYIESSPLYVAPEPTPAAKPERPERPAFDPNNPHNMIAVLPTTLKRW